LQKKFIAIWIIALFLAAFAAPRNACADTLILKNGDHLTGTISDSDGKQVTLKTDFAGDIKVQLSAITDITSSAPLYVATPQKTTVNGNVTVAGSDLIVHTASAGDVHVPLAQVTIIRSAAEEQSYEMSLHPGLLHDWTGGVNVGLAFARGNSDTTSLNTAFNADRKTLADETKLYLSSVYDTSGANELTGAAGGVTANAILAGARYDRNFDTVLFGFGSADYTHDQLQGLDLQSIYSGGLGWHAIKKPNTTLDVLFGANFTRETYSATAATPNVDRNLAALTLGENFTQKLGKNTVLTADFLFYPDMSDLSQYRFALDSSVITKINKWLGWQTTLSDRYVSNPPIPLTKTNDFIFSTGLNIAFTH
jgi:putative salt-induced outer membrane protein YdiY